MKIVPVKTKIFTDGEDLVRFVIAHVLRLSEKSVVVITSKIVALSESRTAIVKNEHQRERIIRKESSFAKKAGKVWLTLKDGMLMANAGIDESNADGKLVLLPRDSFESAARLRLALKRAYKLEHLGVLITDSRVVPLRAGVTAALGYAGFKGIRYRGEKDLFGRKFRFEQTNVADSLATAATLVMGEGAERQPLAVVVDAPVIFVKKINKNEVRILASDDLYRPIMKISKHSDTKG
jgi:dihydrofolate synthase / folylpolyglutamate synthase